MVDIKEVFSDPWFRGLNTTYRLIWLYILTLPVDGGGKVQIKESDIIDNCGNTAFTMDYLLRELGPKKLTRIEGEIYQRPDLKREKLNKVQFEREKMKELERIYKFYPRKIGKADGMKRLKTQIKTPGGLALFEKAVLNYARYCEKENDKRFIKHFSSFVGSNDYPSWPEWADWDEEQSSGKFDSLINEVFS